MVTDAFVRIMPNFTNSEWLPASHKVGKNPRSVREAPPHSPRRAKPIAEYVAASVPLHVADSWTYFGRAMSAVSSGAIEVAQHLLYYSELRAMHALLFRHGVVLLNKKNFVLTTTGTVNIPFPTSAKYMAENAHQSIWVLFRHWTKMQASAAFYSKTIQLRGEPLSKWAAERPLQSSLKSVIGPLMERWGMDVARFSNDRELRNQLSYNPTRIQLTPTGMTPAYVADLFQQVWMLLEPEPSNAFEALDRHIMRDTFEAFVTQDHKSRQISVPNQYGTMNEYWVEKVLGLGSAKSVANFFDDPAAQPGPAILSDAGRDLSGLDLTKQLTGMIGRSLVLLRFATGASRDLLTESGCSTSQVDFWLEDMLTLHGIQPPAGTPRNYLDLYDGIRDMVDDIGILESETDPANLAMITEVLAEQFQTLSGFERVPAWAVA
ncbi:hypothetical protein IWX81_002897 [Salinibacterium sp. CAN_S4]|uniref:hypothetical protein n=1 Tax=Salinibacterium sp. CAN_S4 TaxID=2787727 RepID=UPI0018F03892